MTATAEIPLFDTHLHLLYPRELDYPWTSGFETLQRDFTLPEYADIACRNGIRSALYMEADVAADQKEAELRFVSELAESSPVSIAGAYPESDAFEDYLSGVLLANPRVRGVRRVLHTVDDGVSQSAAFRKNIQAIGRAGLTFDLCLRADQLPLGIELAQACPETPIILDHCGNPDASGVPAPEWRAAIREIAECPNVAGKLSGIISGTPPGRATLDAFAPFLDAMLESFGPDRLAWGSDWPVCNLSGSGLPAWIRLFREWLSTLSEEDQSKIAHRNAARIYAIPGESASPEAEA